MKKSYSSRWNLLFLICLLIFTLYQVLPTLFYHLRPLQQPIDAVQGKEVHREVDQRIRRLEHNSFRWLQLFAKDLGLHPTKLQVIPEDRKTLVFSFPEEGEASLFRKALQEAGNAIPFSSQRFAPLPAGSEKSSEVWIHQEIIHPEEEGILLPFSFIRRNDPERGSVSKEYRQLIYEQIDPLISFCTRENPDHEQLRAILRDSTPGRESALLLLGEQLLEREQLFGMRAPLFLRTLSWFFLDTSGEENLQEFKLALQQKNELIQQQEEQNTVEHLRWKQLYEAADRYLALLPQLSAPPLSSPEECEAIKASLQEEGEENGYEEFLFSGAHPLLRGIALDWEQDQLFFLLHEDLLKKEEEPSLSTQEGRESYLFSSLLDLAQMTGRELHREAGQWFLSLFKKTDLHSLLHLRLKDVAEKEREHLLYRLRQHWEPAHIDLQEEQNFPIYSYRDYRSLPQRERGLGLVIYIPLLDEQESSTDLQRDSIYLMTQGVSHILEKYRGEGELHREDLERLQVDFQQLSELLNIEGFHNYSEGDVFSLPWLKGEWIFEKPLWALPLLKATREEYFFSPDREAVSIACSTVEQRLLSLNAIEKEEHEEYVQWRDLYKRSKIEREHKVPFFPPPVKVLQHNLFLSAKKYFRGDERKILRWGLDLAGGKSIQMELYSPSGQKIIGEKELQAARNELHNRVNRMGVSEVSVRIEGNTLVLDFPSSQGYSARELVQGSSMSFHFVNEPFAEHNQEVQLFLKRVWNEALFTHQTDLHTLNQIAHRLLKEERSKAIGETSLSIEPLDQLPIKPFLDETESMVAIYRDREERIARVGHPLQILFRNYSLRGKDLRDVQPTYDITQGHLLSFSVASSTEEGNDPRQFLQTWTEEFAKNRVVGTVRENFSSGRGWRMAILLNGEIITDPELHQPLIDSGSITGRFTQREVQRLASDLRAGTLSFTPKIVSEQNINPELGQREKKLGLIATSVGFFLVVLIMISFYGSAGAIASLALLFNLLLIWAFLQNVHAVLTLSGIAGILLTVGMAVDANVLIFERVREEYRKSKRWLFSLRRGYKRAFTAILDANITTCATAFCLLQFGSGAVKGFALTLMAGLFSSLFTSITLTRLIFEKWFAERKWRFVERESSLFPSSFSFLRRAPHFFSFVCVLSLIGGALYLRDPASFVGMEFKGGYTLDLELQNKGGEKPAFREQVADLFIQKGIGPEELHLLSLGRENALRLQFSAELEEGRAPSVPSFHWNESEKTVRYPYEKNLFLRWIVETLEEGGLHLRESSLAHLHQQWNHTSGQISQVVRHRALLSILLSLLLIFFYITIRFTWKYASAALLALLHDLCLTLASLSIARACGLSIQIDMQVIAALLTLLGYSLNDTIVIFDRMREEGIQKKKSLVQWVDSCLHATLNRTLLTSGTTLAVLFSLLFFGGRGLLSFSFTLSIGVIVGTLSSLLVAPPITVYLHQKT